MSGWKPRRLLVVNKKRPRQLRRLASRLKNLPKRKDSKQRRLSAPVSKPKRRQRRSD